MKHDNMSDIYAYMRAWSEQLGQRILQEYPALHRFEDPVSTRIDALLRRPFPAQSIATWELPSAGKKPGQRKLWPNAVPAKR